MNLRKSDNDFVDRLNTALRSGESESSDVLAHATDNMHVALLLQLSVFTAVGALLMLLAPFAPWSFKLLLISLVFLTLKRWGGVLVLLLVQCDLCFREGIDFQTLTGSGGILFVLVVVATLMFVARQRLLLQQIASSSVISLAKEFFNSTDNPNIRDPAFNTGKEDQIGGPFFRLIASALRGVTVLFLCVLSARLLLSFIPKNRALTGHLRNLVNADPAMWAATGVLISLTVIWIVVSEISWRQLTAAQARMYLRSTFVKAHFRDLRMIVLRRIGIRKKLMSEVRSGKEKSENHAPSKEASP